MINIMIYLFFILFQQYVFIRHIKTKTGETLISTVSMPSTFIYMKMYSNSINKLADEYGRDNRMASFLLKYYVR